jgi:cobalt-zinc-cadmium efflux system outer membrane protein
VRARWTIVALALSVSGCARFTPQPLSPSETAAGLEARTLEVPGFRAFLETNLRRRFETWPPKSWGFEELSLAALYYHPSLDVARAEWRVTLAGRKTAAGRPNPVVTATPGYDFNSTGLSPWLPLIFVDLPIETAGKRRFRTAQAGHLSESARFNIATTAWRTRANLRAALLDHCAARQREALLQSQQAIQEKIVRSLGQQLEAGAVSSSELTLVRIALDKTLLDLTDAREQAADSRVRVSDAIGVPVKALEGFELDYDFTPPALAPSGLLSAEAREKALQNRADILGALADYAASQSALQLEIAKQYPDLHLGPGYQFDHGEHTFTLDLTAELPVLNQNQGPIAEAEARRAAAAARFLALQAQVITATDRAAAVYRVARERLSTIESLASSQNKQTAVVEAQQNAGAAAPLDLLNARIELGAARLLEFDGRVKLQQSFAALEDAVQRPIDAIQPGLIEQSQRASAPRNHQP